LILGLVLTGFAGHGPAAGRAGEADVGSDARNPHVWRPQTRSVAVFKNGLGFFMREGEVRLRDGWCIAGEVPPAAFGTLAIYSRGEQSVVDVVGSGPGEVVEFDGRDAPADVGAKRARLEASRQLKVELSYKHRGLDRTAGGTLVSVGPDFVVLEDETGNFAVPLEGVTKMQVLELPLRIHVATEAEDALEEETLGMAYLRKGITWIPDYTVYTKENLTLRRGEKAILTLFTRKIRYSHIYHWSPPGTMTHSLVLHNATDTAWTTGPCLVMSDGRLLSEDLLGYTPKGAVGELPVTTAINIAHTKAERETERKLNAHSVPHNNVYFDLVTLDGELKLHNYEKRTVEIVISNPVPGKPLAASDGGTLQTDPTKLKLDEREGTVTWRVKLEPGERKSLTYQYERYVRPN
jgi:hypothetical protein